MSAEEVAYQALAEADKAHDEILKAIDIFNGNMISKSENIHNLVEEKEDKFKKEINNLNELITSSQEKLTDLTNTYMIQQRDNTESETKINEINFEINKLNDAKTNILPSKLNAMEKTNNLKLQYLHEKKLKLKRLILKNENRIKTLLSQCKMYETYFGINCCVVENTQNLKISFKQIDKYQPENIYFIIISTTFYNNNKYKIVQLNQENNDKMIKYLEHKLNSNIGFSKFIKIVRKYFVLSAAKDRANNDVNMINKS